MSLANHSQNLQLQLEQLRELQQLQEQQQQQQQLQEQHPLLSAIAENNYAQTQRVHYPNHYYPSNHYHYQQQGRPLLAAAGSSHNGAYAATAPYSGHSGHGHIEPSVEYELQQTPPSGGFTSYHASAGSAPALSMGMPHPPPHPPRPPPHPPAIHSYSYPKPPPPTRGSAGKKSKKNSSGVMSALTLLSFFFFLNLLQNCIKDHMSDMNPTVMVLTDTASRNRFNKLAEMNSREQTSSPTPSWQQAALVPVPDSGPGSVPVSSPAPVIVKPTVVLQSPYSGAAAAAAAVVTNKAQYHQNQHHPHPHPHHHPHHNHNPATDSHHYPPPPGDDDDDVDYNYGHRRPPPGPPQTSAADFYPNRTTHIDHSSRPDFDSDSDSDYYQHHYYPERHRYSDSRYSNPRRPWSYGGAASHAGSGGSSIRQRYSSAPWSSASLGAQSGVSSYLDNAQRRQGDDDDAAAAAAGHGFDADADDDDGRHHRRRGDAFYTRIN